MAGNLRREILLKHFDKIEQIVDNIDYTTSTNGKDITSGEGNDIITDLPSIKNASSRRQSSTANTVDPNLEKWSTYFEVNKQITFEERNFKFNIYYTLPKSLDTTSIPIFVFHHGAGSSGLSFANLSQTLQEKLKGQCGCFSFDSRGHGNTTVIDPEQNVSYERDSFIEDFRTLLEYIYSNILSAIPKEKLSIILVGHSLGGSICTFTFPVFSIELRKHITGITMLDIVEEAAKDALNKVDNFLSMTPNVFLSYSDAINWYVRHGLSKNRTSANIAVPSLFRKFSSGKVVRITNLQVFRPYWNTWFTDLSHSFVAVPTSKMLILAGNDNLDKELIIGQMQGKYQLVVFQDSGHFIQEDETLKTALTLIDFWKRNDNKNVIIKTNWGSAK
ncbi:similar to Saccharomyces cerevisiae YHR075C PPE1 Protein with carboxyl methyl esterase activity that may have a role in demethylation of the phosphoprotein phosphatase catalytic subunit [Maudiozyma barnettii]|uniref:Protein phosphatase methylesterase 1 n=1 Tax=Maudiozyma barnettii TaxID=61262 RepID=A0A8H2VBS1_9SACH|nr:carboxylesterase-mitochondrial 37S ribosomal protein YmS2 [Kazachstania barnettii]CAB4252348.1 similar to Saccharomyces cerevisiae YHR075C PPE1 Protein with carboxyl methyl esterase activity that may have a role in demethylation of the phosphoprotein phosphatase catalytic subunit [Kazachstania barnettii]CAD1779082.1 similar to Saccharomyces cerevisiae YHR075C PPE1 Protein with carboxyl methyl esterase activity that may have a role in demethylation of the phosphoprotein phosphatase catalytic su